MIQGYLAATATSVGVALITRTMFAKSLAKMSGPKLTLANAALNYLAAALAGPANLALIRYKELQEGVDIQSEQGDVTYGKSKEAGRQAIIQTAITRAVLPLPVLFLPALGHSLLSLIRLWPKNRLLSKFMELGLVAGSLTVALPMSVALFQNRS